MTDDETVLDYPEVRSEREVIAAFIDLADECEKRTNPEDVPDRFVTAFRLMLEARVPREPETDEELRVMLQRSIDDPSPSLSTVELGKRLEEDRALFLDFKTQFELKLACSAYESAAMMLMPVEGRTGPGYWGHGGDCSYYPFSMGVGDNGSEPPPRCTIWRPASLPDTAVHCVYSAAPLPGLAMLAAILKAHAEWHEIWKR